MGADAQRAEPVHEAHCGVDVARYGPAPAEVVAVEVEVVLEVELVDECRDLGPLSDGFDDRELDRGRVDVDLDDDEVLRRRLGHGLEDLEERGGRVRALGALRLLNLALDDEVVEEADLGRVALTLRVFSSYLIGICMGTLSIGT